MADQGVRYVVSLQDMNVTSGLRNMEGSAVSAERSVASLNDTLRTLAGAFGVGFGLHMLVDFGKDAVQGAADYETAVKRIKFASADLVEGGKNIAFIAAEADKFKIPLQSATDSYGKFLAMLAGSDIQSDKVRKLHDELLLIGKVKGLGDGQLDAAVMNLGKMLESGSLDARHFRPLEQQLSGIGAFVAKELGITVHELAVLRNKGKMTTIDPHVLLTAIEKQAASLEKFLPESTTTIQSQLNELDNAWLKFKNDLVYDNIGELRSLFDTLKEGVGWLKEHEKSIISLGSALITIGTLWVKYKIAMGAVNLVQATYAGYMGAYLSNTATEVEATEMRAVAMNSLAASMERVALASEAMAGISGLSAIGVPLANAGMGYTAATGASVSGGNTIAAAAGAGGIAATAGRLVTPVMVAYFASEAVAQMMRDPYTGKALHAGDLTYNPYNQMVVGENILSLFGFDPVQNAIDEPNARKRRQQQLDDASGAGLMGDWSKRFTSMIGPYAPGYDPTKAAPHKEAASKISAPTDKITGQRVVTYNIDIKEIIGVKGQTNNIDGGGLDIDAIKAAIKKQVPEELRDIILSIVNDSQIQSDH